MSRPAGHVAADILLSPGSIVVAGVLGYLLFSVIRAATAGGSDRASAAAQPDTRMFPVVATFVGLSGSPRLIAIATNNAQPLFAIGPAGIAYRVIRRYQRSFAAIERVELHMHWRTVNVEFRFRGALLTLAVNAGTEALAREILRAIPADVPMGAAALALRNRP